MKQTAVEWLVKELKLEGYDYTVKQAKKMEKEQIIHAWWSGENDSSFDPKILDEMAEQYYNENFKK